jgi:competence protein ComEC
LEARRGGWHASGYCKSGRLVTKTGRASGALALAGRVRAELRRRLVALVPPGPEQAVVRAMVLGDRTGLERETEEAFRIAGTYHVLALSGAQVALVAALLLWPLRYLCTSPALQAAVVSSLLGGYALLVGADVPVVRAVLMAVTVLVGRCVDLDADAANLLGGAGLLLLLARPGDCGDAGFQLSFAATLGLLLLTPKVIAWAPLLPLRLELALATSLAAQLALLPLLAFHFHRVAPAALVLNLLAVPLSTAVLLAGVAVLLASTLGGWLAAPLGVLAFGAARALLWSGTVVEGVPFLDARVATPAAGFVVLYVVGLLGIVFSRAARASWLLTGSTALALVLGLPAPVATGRLELTVLDVGQGDCLVVRSPAGRTMLVDSGGSFEGRLAIGERVLGPYLWFERIHGLDLLLLTHAHPDHVGGAPFLLKNFAVAEVWEGLAPRHDRGYETLDQTLRAALVARRAVVRGNVFDWDGARVAVLGPRGHSPPPFTQNDDSVVLKLTLGRVSLLLAGDVEASGEVGLAPGAAQVLKVAHHGSRTSSGARLLAEVRPRVAIVSAGKANPFGHPHPELVERLGQAGAWLLRTDRDGAIKISTDGEAVWLETRTVGPARVQ